MSLVPVVLSLAAGICLYAGIIHLVIGLSRHPRDLTHVTFGLASLAIAGNSLAVLAIHTASSVDAYVAAFKFGFGPIGMLVVLGVLWFVAFYTNAKPQVFLLAMSLWFTVIVVLELVLPYGILFAEISGLRAISLPWGEQYVIAQATPHPWRLVVDLFFVFFFGFLFYATYRQYRSGHRGRARLLALSIALFFLANIFDSLVDTGVIDSIYIIELAYLGFVLTMSLTLSREIIETETDLHRYQQRLESLVEERTTELQHSNVQLGRVNKELAREIGVRVQAEEALTVSHRTARALLDAPPDSALLIDPEGTILDINETAAARLGTSEAKAKGTSTYDLLEPGVAEARRAKVAEALESGQPVRWEDVRSGRYIDNSLYPIHDDSGQVASIAVFGADITERRQAESALRRRVEELAILNHVAQTLATMTDLPSALGQVSAMLTGLFGARYSHVLLPVGGEPALKIMVGFDRESGPVGTTSLNIPLEEMPVLERALHGTEAVAVPDVRSLPLDGPIQEFVESRGVQSMLLVPLLSRGTTMGLLVLALDQPDRPFTQAEIRLAETFAGDLAAAVENARLAEQAQAVAVSEERGRIARDLHDSVTQTLYSASLIAEALPRVWDRNPAEVKPNLTALLRLIRGALAEMRTLLFELRPVALEEASLSRLLHQQADLLTGRTQTPVEVTVQGETDVPAEVKIALYRIAQEAFNNIIKHARATQVAATLRNLPDEVILTIEDNGRGFDPGSVSAGRMGLHIMHERARRIGADLAVESKPGRGTEISVVWAADERLRTEVEG